MSKLWTGKANESIFEHLDDYKFCPPKITKHYYIKKLRKPTIVLQDQNRRKYKS